MKTIVLEPEFFVDFDGKVRTGSITLCDGKVVAFDRPIKNEPDLRLSLPDQVILPGFVNAHSHVFQRALRGQVEIAHSGKDNFWQWRHTMYRLANSLSPDALFILAKLTYLEMLEAGFTHVGEFHYLHHDVGGKPYHHKSLMTKILSDAAHESGINLCVLETAYHQNNFSSPLTPEQERFGFSCLDDYLAFVLATKELLDDDLVKIGLALHSVRAVPETWFSAVNDLALKHNLPLHIHVGEQKLENEACFNAKGCSPIALLERHHLLAPHTTLIHATHLMHGDLLLLKEGQPSICICPSTEKNLGDGIVPLFDLLEQKLRICIGTDQHVRLDPFCEARSLEETERLRLQKRIIINKDQDALYPPLLTSLTKSGLSSLYPDKNFESLLDQKANLVALELPPEYLWHGPIEALDAMMLSYNPSKITTVIANGEVVLEKGKLKNTEKTQLIGELKNILKFD